MEEYLPSDEIIRLENKRYLVRRRRKLRRRLFLQGVSFKMVCSDLCYAADSARQSMAEFAVAWTEENTHAPQH